MKNLSLAPPITCQRCKAMVFPHIREGVYCAECQQCGWKFLNKPILNKQYGKFLEHMSASQRFNKLCDQIETQGKSGELLKVLRQNFSEFMVYVESEEMKRCDALSIGVNTLATLAVLKHI